MRIAILLAWLVLGGAGCRGSVDPIRGFVEQEGEHVIHDSGRYVRVFPQGDRLNVGVGDEHGFLYAFNTADQLIDPGAPWFVFVESGDRVWAYNGARYLIFYSSEDSQRKVLYSLDAAGDWLRKQMPPEVSKRLPGDL